jgi:hypothetical protein
MASQQLEIEDRGSHLLFVLKGAWSAAQAVQLVESIGRRCDETLHRCALVDISGLESRLQEFERFVLGQRIAARLPGGAYRMAVLARPDQITRLTENVAVNRGADVMVTSDREEALSWLLPAAPGRAASEAG